MAVLFHGDCLDVMPTLAPGSVDAIITDLPYGTTACEWDSIIPFATMWEAVKHVLKPHGAFVTTASQPFTSALVMSNPKWFRQELIWDKVLSVGFLDAKIKHLRRHENIILFSATGRHVYNPQMVTRGKPRNKGRTENAKNSDVYHTYHAVSSFNNTYYPTSIIENSNASRVGKIHPTQKPVALYEYLIRTYTNEGDTVLDFTMGSGTTGVAAVQTGRNFIGIEKNAEYFAVAEKRIKQAEQQPALFYQLPKNTYPERDVQTPLLCDVMQ